MIEVTMEDAVLAMKLHEAGLSADDVQQLQLTYNEIKVLRPYQLRIIKPNPKLTSRRSEQT